MDCMLCSQPERAYNFGVRQRVEVVVGSLAERIICSNCVQRLLGSDKGSRQRLYDKVAARGDIAEAGMLARFFNGWSRA